jgi:hypothetical protein
LDWAVQDGPNVGGSSHPDHREQEIAISFGFRGYISHNIQHQPVLTVLVGILRTRDRPQLMMEVPFDKAMCIDESEESVSDDCPVRK